MQVRVVDVDAATGEAVERWIELPGVLTVEEAAAADLVLRGEAARAQRNARLLASDWTELPSAQSRFSEVERAGWATYRQALRDVTAQVGFPDAIAWPTLPPEPERMVVNDA